MLLILVYHDSCDYETLWIVTMIMGYPFFEMDNESLCGCDVLSYAPLCYFGDFHDYGL